MFAGGNCYEPILSAGPGSISRDKDGVISRGAPRHITVHRPEGFPEGGETLGAGRVGVDYLLVIYGTMQSNIAVQDTRR